MSEEIKPKSSSTPPNLAVLDKAQSDRDRREKILNAYSGRIDQIAGFHSFRLELSESESVNVARVNAYKAYGCKVRELESGGALEITISDDDRELVIDTYARRHVEMLMGIDKVDPNLSNEEALKLGLRPYSNTSTEKRKLTVDIAKEMLDKLPTREQFEARQREIIEAANKDVFATVS